MKLAGRLAAAMDVLAQVEARRRPASEALKDWGTSNRFAGSGDRAAIGNLVYDALRRRASHAYTMGSDTPRALILSVAVRDWAEDAAALNASFEGDRFAPSSMTDDETMRLTAADPLAGAPDWVRADVPEWTAPSLAAAWGDDWIAEGHAMTGRPPLDLRINTLRSTRERVEKSLARFHPQPTAYAVDGFRFPAGPRDARTPNVTTDEGYQKGWFEVQDQGSQLAAILAGAKPGEQVLDLCAGAGGKTLAMAAAMGNKGQIFAYDRDRARLAPIYERLKRNGVRDAQVRAPESGALDDLVGKMDRVVIDAPCTGSGTWRRRPDAKWRLTADQLAARVAEQRTLLAEAVRYLKPDGELAYITCSIFPEENEQQLGRFLADHPDFRAVAGPELWGRHFGEKQGPRFPSAGGVAMSPHLTETDGFYIVVCTRAR
jgi:16S rRNA (cytosine967-C5)-methyltransferase